MSFFNPSASSRFPRGHLFGMGLANNAGDLTNDIDFAAGACRDSTDAFDMTGAALTKQLDAAWVAGNAAGGRLSAAAIANATYFCFAIRKDSDGSVDYGFDVSPTAPTMPSGYSKFRRIGCILRESGAIVGFIQDGDRFIRSPSVAESADSNPGTSAFSKTIKTPVGLRTRALLALQISSTAVSQAVAAKISDLSISDETPGATNSELLIQSQSTSGTYRAKALVEIMTNASAQVRARLSFSDAGVQLSWQTLGWVDDRGRLA